MTYIDMINQELVDTYKWEAGFGGLFYKEITPGTTIEGEWLGNLFCMTHGTVIVGKYTIQDEGGDAAEEARAINAIVRA